jgi:hypothetical protein
VNAVQAKAKAKKDKKKGISEFVSHIFYEPNSERAIAIQPNQLLCE